MEESNVYELPILDEVVMKELTFEETLEALFKEEVILLTTYDNDRSKNMLIRFKETRNGIVTQITKPSSSMDGFVSGKKYWSIYDVNLNDLSMYPTYIYDPVKYNTGNKYETKSTVRYISSLGDEDIAIVMNVYSDDEGGFHYKLSGEGDLTFKEEELAPM